MIHYAADRVKVSSQEDVHYKTTLAIYKQAL